MTDPCTAAGLDPAKQNQLLSLARSLITRPANVSITAFHCDPAGQFVFFDMLCAEKNLQRELRIDMSIALAVLNGEQFRILVRTATQDLFEDCQNALRNPPATGAS